MTGTIANDTTIYYLVRKNWILATKANHTASNNEKSPCGIFGCKRPKIWKNSIDKTYSLIYNKTIYE